jgi:hypothetical protein
MRGELSTFVADAAISTGMTPATEPFLSEQWLTDLAYSDAAASIRRTLKHFLDTPSGCVATLAAAVRFAPLMVES